LLKTFFIKILQYGYKTLLSQFFSLKNQEVKPQNMASLLQLFYQYYFNNFFGYHW